MFCWMKIPAIKDLSSFKAIILPYSQDGIIKKSILTLFPKKKLGIVKCLYTSGRQQTGHN